jgi:hypothetical protein
MASRLVRANAVTVNDVLAGHKLLAIGCVDRVYLTSSVLTLVVGGQLPHRSRAPADPFTCTAGAAGAGVPPGGELLR